MPDTLLDLEDLDPHYLSKAQVIQFVSLLLATEPSWQTPYHALNIAQTAGLILSYVQKLRLTAWQNEAVARPGVSGSHEVVNIHKINRAELAFLSGKLPHRQSLKSYGRINSS